MLFSSFLVWKHLLPPRRKGFVGLSLRSKSRSCPNQWRVARSGTGKLLSDQVEVVAWAAWILQI